jgi:hypothetical protein
MVVIFALKVLKEVGSGTLAYMGHSLIKYVTGFSLKPCSRSLSFLKEDTSSLTVGKQVLSASSMLLVLMLTTSVKASIDVKIKHRDLIMFGHILNHSPTISVYNLGVQFIFLSSHVFIAVKRAKMLRYATWG